MFQQNLRMTRSTHSSHVETDMATGIYNINKMNNVLIRVHPVITQHKN